MSSTGGDATRDQFEHRMRMRRAATCVRAARQAMAEGRLIDAEERLDEACRLDPDEAEARLLLEELRTVNPSEPAGVAQARERQGSAGWSHWFAAGVAILALAALAFFWPADNRVRRPETPARRAPASPVIDLPAAVQLQPVPASTGPVAESGKTPDVPVATTGTRPERIRPDAAAEAGIARMQPPASQRLEPSDRPAAPPPDTPPPIDFPAGATVSALPPSVALAERGSVSTPPPPTRSVGPVAAVQLEVGRPLESQAKPPAEPPAPQPQPEPALASMRPPPGPSDEQLIRDTLQNYADAYARLDAPAAKRVWPTVDAEALRRAFDGLESQSLTFERCELRVTGADAVAACRGRANFVPKVGRREPLAVSRLWTFTLRKGEGGWAIRSADAR